MVHCLLTKHLTLGLGGDTDIFTKGELVGHESGAAHGGSGQDGNDGVGGHVREPIVGQGVGLFEVHGSRRDGAAGSHGAVD